jgi:hypothetical protein
MPLRQGAIYDVFSNPPRRFPARRFPSQALLEQAMGPGAARPQPGQPLVSIPTGNDVVQIFLE